jgi:hypothetical protein
MKKMKILSKKYSPIIRKSREKVPLDMPWFQIQIGNLHLKCRILGKNLKNSISGRVVTKNLTSLNRVDEVIFQNRTPKKRRYWKRRAEEEAKAISKARKIGDENEDEALYLSS